MKSNLLSLIILLGSLAPAMAIAEKTGNGGGSWVCRDQGPSGPVRTAVSLDLWEAAAPKGEGGMGLKLQRFAAQTYVDIVRERQLRLFEIDRDLYEGLEPYFARLGNLSPSPAKNVRFVAGLLSRIPDSEWSNGPAPETFCPNGTMLHDPEQVIRYTDGAAGPLDEASRIEIRKPLWNALDEANRAAFVFHEAVYAYRRDIADDKNSVVTRQVVGLIFSTLPVDEVRKALEALGVSEESTGTPTCGLKGSVEERFQDCGRTYLRQRSGGGKVVTEDEFAAMTPVLKSIYSNPVQLIARTGKYLEIVRDTRTGMIWPTQGFKPKDLGLNSPAIPWETARRVCAAPSAKILRKFMAGLRQEVEWRLPLREDIENLPTFPESPSQHWAVHHTWLGGRETGNYRNFTFTDWGFTARFSLGDRMGEILHPVLADGSVAYDRRLETAYSNGSYAVMDQSLCVGFAK